MRQFTRSEILDRLNKKINNGKAILIGGAGIGSVAQTADKSGIDMIMAYNTGPYRMDGCISFMGYLSYGDSNAVTADLAETILPVVNNTPVIGGVGASDPYRDPLRVVDDFINKGYSGITTVPCNVSYQYGNFRKIMEEMGIGIAQETKVVRYCREHDIFTIQYAFTEDEVKEMVQAGTDILAIHVGGTIGGTTGTSWAMEKEKAFEWCQYLCEVAKKENPDVIVVNHGGIFTNAEICGECYRKTDIQGNIGASSIERIPVEDEVTHVIKQFKTLKIRR